MNTKIEKQNQTMKVAACTHYGSAQAVEIQERPMPTPKNKQVLVQVVATTVSSGDSRIRSLNVPKGFGLILRLAFGFLKPRNPILGTELAGVITEVGPNVTAFSVGNVIFADCGIAMGAHAQYRLFEESDVIFNTPKNLTVTQCSALIFGGSTAYYFIKEKAKLAKGESILINGASGTVGTAAIQLAKQIGATVTSVCSKDNHNLVKSLGSDYAVHYGSDKTANSNEQTENSLQSIIESGQQFDVIMDNVGNLSWQNYHQALKSNGRFIKVVSDLVDTFFAPLYGLGSSKKCIVGTAFADVAMLKALKNDVENGLYKPIIDCYFDLDNIQNAHAYVDTNHKKGSVVILCHPSQ